eukprot:COSAG01_NODE_74422_length_214_cov_1.808696_1_plen_44_part_10
MYQLVVNRRSVVRRQQGISYFQLFLIPFHYLYYIRIRRNVSARR